MLEFFFWKKFFLVGFLVLTVKMHQKPPGSKSKTVTDNEEFDTIVFGTSELQFDYGKWTEFRTEWGMGK